MTRPVKSHLKRNRKLVDKIEKVEAHLEEVDEAIKTIDVPMVAIAVGLALKGNVTGEQVHRALNASGYKIGILKSYKILKAARAKIALMGERDMSINYGWAQANLMDIHKNAIEADDDKMRLVTIRQLIELWGLNRPHEEVKETEITPEMIEQFEQRLLR